MQSPKTPATFSAEAKTSSDGDRSPVTPFTPAEMDEDTEQLFTPFTPAEMV